jgi:hypothetical protein
MMEAERKAALPGFDAVPGLEEVVQAFRKAERAEDGGPGFTVCVANADGLPFAAEHLGSYNQVKVFSRAMAKIGYQASIAGAPRHGCDVIYSQRKAARDIFDDGGPHSTLTGT